MGQGESLATSADPLAWRQDAGRQACDRKPRQENAGGGRQDLVISGGQMERNAVATTSWLSNDAAAANLYSQE